MARVSDFSHAENIWRNWSAAYNDNPEYRISDIFMVKAQKDGIEKAVDFLVNELDWVRAAANELQDGYEKCYGERDFNDWFAKCWDGFEKIEAELKKVETMDDVQSLFKIIQKTGRDVDNVIEIIPSEGICPEDDDDEYENDDESFTSRKTSGDDPYLSANYDRMQMNSKHVYSAVNHDNTDILIDAIDAIDRWAQGFPDTMRGSQYDELKVAISDYEEFISDWWSNYQSYHDFVEDTGETYVGDYVDANKDDIIDFIKEVVPYMKAVEAEIQKLV